MGTTVSSPSGRPGLLRPDSVLLRLQLIGRMQALTLDNRSVLPLGRKTRALLAILALSGRRPVLRLRLAELLWSRRSEEQARASLRQEIHRLLDALNPVGADVVAVDRHTLALKPGLTSVDAERILNAGPSHADSLPSLDGVLLEELNGTDPALDLWLKAERERLRAHALTLFEGLLNRQRDPRGVLEGARQLLLIDPAHEMAWRATIRARQAMGETMPAREAAQRCAAAMAERFGIPPAAETVRLLAEYGCALPGAGDPSPGGDPADVAVARGPAGADDPGAAAHPPFAAAAAPAPPVPMRRRSGGLPLLAVLPLLDLDGRADRRALTHGVAEALRVALLRHGSLRVLSGGELDAALEDGRDDASLRRRFGIDYVLDGTVQGEGDQLRAVLRMTDIRQHGQIVWGGRFRAAETGEAFLDRVVGEASARLPIELMLLESHRLRRRPITELEPEQLVLRAFSAILTSDRTRMARAMTLLDRSFELGVDTPVALAVDALANLLRALQRWDPTGAAAARAIARSTEAVERAADLSAALMVRCLVRSELENEPDAALALGERAMELQPFSSGSIAATAFPLMRLGRLDEARTRFEAARALFPTHPLDMVLDPTGTMLAVLDGRTGEAARRGLLGTELHPCFAPAIVPYLAALGHLDRRHEAARARRQLLALWPDAGIRMLVERAGLRGAGHADRLADGLRAAGLEDEPRSIPDSPGTRLGGDSLAG